MSITPPVFSYCFPLNFTEQKNLMEEGCFNSSGDLSLSTCLKRCTSNHETEDESVIHCSSIE